MKVYSLIDDLIIPLISLLVWKNEKLVSFGSFTVKRSPLALVQKHGGISLKGTEYKAILPKNTRRYISIINILILSRSLAP